MYHSVNTPLVSATATRHRACGQDNCTGRRHQQPADSNRSHQLHHHSMFQPLYALRVLRGHGLPEQSVKDVFQATVFGFCTAADRNRLDSFLHVKLGFWSSNNTPCISTIAVRHREHFV